MTLTATDSVWLKIYDATGKTLLEKTLAQGERYEVPADANNPMINVGRPDQIQVTINGSMVAPLGDGKVAIQDVPISAAALQARGTGVPVATPPPAATTSPTGISSVPPAFRSSPSPAKRPTPRPTPSTAPTPENLLPPSITPTTTP